MMMLGLLLLPALLWTRGAWGGGGQAEQRGYSATQLDGRERVRRGKCDHQAQMEGHGRWEEGSSSSHGTSSPARMRTPAAKKSVAPARSSMPRRRQQAFIKAMEAEARSSETCSKRSSLLSLYTLAKRLNQDKEQHTHKR
ncbi:hypothetical protein PC123_g22774 [Phytophthora cactorum]|nr:hypothetical protein PC123_g22774 [Phytophthora cactorum]